MRGKVGTWVNSQWKYQATPGQFSVAINRLSLIDHDGNSAFGDWDCFQQRNPLLKNLDQVLWRRISQDDYLDRDLPKRDIIVFSDAFDLLQMVSRLFQGSVQCLCKPKGIIQTRYNLKRT